jgi:hypothetical protein
VITQRIDLSGRGGRFEPKSAVSFRVSWGLIAALTCALPAHAATTWFTIVSDRGCEISPMNPAQYQQALLGKGVPSRQDVRHWQDGSFMGVDVVNTDETGERNQWFFIDPQTCLDAAKTMGVPQQ